MINDFKLLTNLKLPLIRCVKNKIKRNDGRWDKIPAEEWKEKIYTDRRPDEFKDYNVAVKLGHNSLGEDKFLVIMDFDFKKPEGKASYDDLIKLHGKEWLKTVCSRTESNGLHLWFWHSETLRVELDLLPGVDFLGLGSISYEPPSQFFVEGKPCNAYRWLTPPTNVNAVQKLPEWVLTLIKCRENSAEEERSIKAMSSRSLTPSQLAFFRWQLGMWLPEQGLERSEWLQVGMALHNATNGSDAAYDVWNEWGTKVQEKAGLPYEEKLAVSSWNSFGKYEGVQTTIATLCKKLAKYNEAKNDVIIAEMNAWAELEIAKAEYKVKREEERKEEKKEEEKKKTKKSERTLEDYIFEFCRLNNALIARNHCTNKIEVWRGAIKRDGKTNKEIKVQLDFKPIFEQLAGENREDVLLELAQTTFRRRLPITDGMEAEILVAFRRWADEEKIPQFKQGNLIKSLILATGEKNLYNPIKYYLKECEKSYDDAIRVLQFDDINYGPNYFRDQFVERLGLRCTNDEEKDAKEWFRKCITFWLEGMICRVLYGFQNPMLVLKGEQGAGKSTLARMLMKNAGKITPGFSYYKEGDINPENKDHRLALTQTMIWEVAELGATTRKADVDKLKSFITYENVDERAAYGRYSETRKAITSFIGSTNEEKFLRDFTGARRFIVCEFAPQNPYLTIDYLRSNTFNPDIVIGESIASLSGAPMPKVDQGFFEHQAQSAERHRVESDLEIFLDDHFEVTGVYTDCVERKRIADQMNEAQIRENDRISKAISWLMKKGVKKPQKVLNGTRYLCGMKLKNFAPQINNKPK